jgi:hypothetical protein
MDRVILGLGVLRLSLHIHMIPGPLSTTGEEPNDTFPSIFLSLGVFMDYLRVGWRTLFSFFSWAGWGNCLLA